MQVEWAQRSCSASVHNSQTLVTLSNVLPMFLRDLVPVYCRYPRQCRVRVRVRVRPSSMSYCDQAQQVHQSTSDLWISSLEYHLDSVRAPTFFSVRSKCENTLSTADPQSQNSRISSPHVRRVTLPHTYSRVSPTIKHPHTSIDHSYNSY